MGSPFRSFGPKSTAKVKPRHWSEAEVVTLAKVLLTEHVERRIEATKSANLVCGNCDGTGKEASTLMPGELVTCHACEGTGKPNEHSIACPEFTHEDNERLWKISQLLQGPHRVAVLQVVKEVYPEIYPATYSQVELKPHAEASHSS